MAFHHGKNTVVTVGGTDLSAFTKESEISEGVDSHDVTHYGDNGHAYQPGLTDGKFTMSGTYATAASGAPRNVLRAVKAGGVAVAIIRQPEGAGSGLPQDSFDGVLTGYVESSPVGDMVTWSAEFSISGDVDDTAQS